MALYLCGLLPQNRSLQAGYKKNFRQLPLEGHFTKCLVSAPQNVKIVKTNKV
jgi:hypothetical protein